MPQITGCRPPLVRWTRFVAVYVLMAIAIAFVFGGIGFRTPWRAAVEGVAVSLLFAVCIGPLLHAAMPRIAPAIWRRLQFPFNWIAASTAMTAGALAGSAVAIALLVAVGYVPVSEFGRWYAGSMRISVVVTLTVGLFITAREMNRALLARANAEAQLASLESRVQPHFLFNTLNSIAALTHDDPASAERMTTQLATLLRSSLDADGTSLVSLGDELALVRHYLDIERVRFGDRLRFTVDADGAPMDARVPRLAIQTLVENSVKYAVSARREGASVAVCVSAARDRLRVTVADDGPGFATTMVPEGHGLALLRARLRMLFPEHASLDIATEAGARVTLDVPLQRQGIPQPPRRS